MIDKKQKKVNKLNFHTLSLFDKNKLFKKSVNKSSPNC